MLPMKSRSVIQNLAIMAVFLGIGLTMFTENVRTVQVLGLLASGAVFGMFLGRVIMALRGGSSGPAKG
jgi:hypothetical protein